MGEAYPELWQALARRAGAEGRGSRRSRRHLDAGMQRLETMLAAQRGARSTASSCSCSRHLRLPADLILDILRERGMRRREAQASTSG
jgi:hypothetical protein